MGGGAGSNFDEPLVLQGAKCAEQIAAKSILERREHPRVPVVIEASQIAECGIACSLKPVHVLRGFSGPLSGVSDKVLRNQRVGQLLTQDRCDTDRQSEWNALFSQVVERVQQWHIGLGNSLVYPLLAMWPHPRLPGVREMAVQHECEGPDWRCHVIPPLYASRCSGSTSPQTVGAISRTRMHV